MKKIIKRTVYVSSLLFVFSGIISCEKDFTDIGTTIISNNVFSTNNVLVDIKIENKPVESFRADNISLEAGQYLLGVYNKADYEKLEASILSQIGISSSLKYSDTIYEADTTVVSTIDTVFLKLPYQATFIENTPSGPVYELDSVFGDQNKAFTLNLYQSDEYLNLLNPQDPSKANEYFSNELFQPIGGPLNSVADYQFIPNKRDTILKVKRRSRDSNVYDIDTIKVATTGSQVPVPFARIPLNETLFKSIFFDKYESSEFSSQDAFNNYFRGLILEATGDEGTLISFNFNSTTAALNPSIEVYYTNTVVKGGTEIVRTIKKSNSFPLIGLRRSHYNMGPSPSVTSEQIKIQGTAGSEGTISLFGTADIDNNGIPDQLDDLRAENVLVNDALLTIYIDQSADTTFTPERLYLYKDGFNSNGQTSLAHIKDVFTEGASFGGLLERTKKGAKIKYNFKIEL